MSKVKYLLLPLLFVFPLIAGFMEIEIVRSANDFEVVSGDFVRVFSDDCVVWGEPGTPQILAEALQVLIPQGFALTDASIDSEVWRPLAEGVPFPAQSPAILSIPSPMIAPPTPSDYRADRWFPENPLLGASSGNMSGFSIGSVVLSPIRWNPAMGICEFLESARITIEYAPNTSISPSRRTPHSDRHWRESIAGIVINPQEINSYSFSVDPSAFDYAIISPPAFEHHFAQLLDLRRSWGLRDTVLITTDIYASFPGIDRAEKLRNAIKDIFIEEGISFVLLAGDTSHIPARKVFAMDCLAGFYPDENEIFADLYFADLDGDWNFNGDTIFGEIADSIDMFADVHIGRLSLTNTTQLAGIIGKLTRYENNRSEHFANSGLMLAQVLWHEPYTDGAIFKDDLVSNVFPDHFDFGRVYGSLGGDAPTALDSMNTGANFINHAGHANIAVMCIDHGSCLFLTDMELLGNFDRPSILYSIGCWPAAFDKDCIAERFVNNPHGGGAAFIGNSRYGWGSPGNPGRGYSEVLDKAFWEEIFRGNYTLGAAHDLSRARYVPFAQWENVWRWVIYELNIIGDPATGAITGFSPIGITCDVEGADVGVRVERLGGAPAGGAIVSARDTYGLIDEAMTDALGFAGLSIAGGVPPIIITARLDGEGVIAETLWVAGSAGFFRWGYSPEHGFDDGRADSGDTVEVVF
ncbi:MAG TPA: hypothetical protein ENN07_06825, partial [candidate division Zixibacteria bacterium]|nr:hypothetical protein [candidate division Zixibacteria bacterium]